MIATYNVLGNKNLSITSDSNVQFKKNQNDLKGMVVTYNILKTKLSITNDCNIQCSEKRNYRHFFGKNQSVTRWTKFNEAAMHVPATMHNVWLCISTINSMK